jgi:hypothetical protein
LNCPRWADWAWLGTVSGLSYHEKKMKELLENGSNYAQPCPAGFYGTYGAKGGSANHAIARQTATSMPRERLAAEIACTIPGGP